MKAYVIEMFCTHYVCFVQDYWRLIHVEMWKLYTQTAATCYIGLFGNSSPCEGEKYILLLPMSISCSFLDSLPSLALWQ